MKFFSGDLNPGSYPLHSTSTYTCKVTITLRICGGKSNTIFNLMLMTSFRDFPYFLSKSYLPFFAIYIHRNFSSGCGARAARPFFLLVWAHLIVFGSSNVWTLVIVRWETYRQGGVKSKSVPCPIETMWHAHELNTVCLVLLGH